MYQQIEGGTIIDIQGLQCSLPPEGYVWNILTKKLEHRGIHRRSNIDSECFWERIPLPVWYKETMKRWDDYDKKKKEEEPDFYDEKLEDFKRSEWDKRLNGMWYQNNDKTVYLTGMHYFYLQWWHIDIGTPKFR